MIDFGPISNWNQRALPSGIIREYQALSHLDMQGWYPLSASSYASGPCRVKLKTITPKPVSFALQPCLDSPVPKWLRMPALH